MTAEKKKRPRRNNQGPKVFAKNVKAKEDVTKALEMRKAGLGVRAVAAHLGRSIGWVSEAVRKAVSDLPMENAMVYRAHVVAREEAIIAAHWTKRAEPEHARTIQASDKLLTALLGLDAPARTELTGAGGAPIIFDLTGVTSEQIRASLAEDDAADAGGAPGATEGGAGSTGNGDGESA